MIRKPSIYTNVFNLLNSELIRRTEQEGRTFYVAVDLVAALSDSRHPDELLADLQGREPQLARLLETVKNPASDADQATLQVVDLAGAMRLIQSIPSVKAERCKHWIAEAARQRIEEQENPELAILRTRKLYEHKGYSRPWVGKRLRGIGSRHEVTREWARRGAVESDDYRQLTNELFQAAFGMNVQDYRASKGLNRRPGANLRDQMTDAELMLTALGESAAAILMRQRDSQGMDELITDARDAGELVARTHSDLQSRSRRPAAALGSV